jgi:hypothetical protein
MDEDTREEKLDEALEAALQARGEEWPPAPVVRWKASPDGPVLPSPERLLQEKQDALQKLKKVWSLLSRSCLLLFPAAPDLTGLRLCTVSGRARAQ